MSGVYNNQGDWIDLDRSVEIKEELIEKFMQQDYVKKEYNEPFKHKLLSRFVNNLLEKWLELQDEAKQ